VVSDLNVELRNAGVTSAELSQHAVTLRQALRDLDRAPEGDFLRVLERPAIVREINAYCKGRPRRITDVVQLGIGGSSLGAQALCAALLPPRHNDLVRPPGLRFHLPDNLDPDHFAALLEGLDPKRTLVHVVSKSGGTLETQAQLHALLAFFSRRRNPIPLRRNLVVTTGPQGALREFAEREGVTVLSFPEDVPGRYSVFTASGLLVPALCGISVGRILTGARRMEALCRRDPMLGPAGGLAALHFIHDQERGRPIHVELIYADGLLLAGDWFRQIWAESLGKSGRGPTPVIARGTTDQHSQIQLYMDGPDDKLYTVIRLDRFRARVQIARRGAPAAIAGRDLGEVLDAEAQGTQQALLAKGRPLVEIRMPRLTPQSIGALLLLQQLQTALAGALYGIDPFTQPGVEAGKVAALKILTR
jgi:glucose-6-phosphate isomerase